MSQNPGKILANTRLADDVKSIRTENGSEFMGEFLVIYDRHRIHYGFKDIGMTQVNGSIERSFENYALRETAARKQPRLLYPDDDLPKGVGFLRYEVCSWIVDKCSRTRASVNPNFTILHEAYFAYSVPLELLRLVAPEFCKRRRISEGSSKAVSCSNMQPAENHPRETTRVIFRHAPLPFEAITVSVLRGKNTVPEPLAGPEDVVMLTAGPRTVMRIDHSQSTKDSIAWCSRGIPLLWIRRA